jgi:hypothetical protein
MMNSKNRSVSALLAVCTLSALPALGQVYQRADTNPIPPGGGSNPPTHLLAVASVFDGGYIAVGREGTTTLHMARYNAAGTVIWSEYAPTNFPISATSINQVGAAANPTYLVAGEIADAYPWGTWVMAIDVNGNLVCNFREINGVGPAFPASRSPVAVKPLADSSYVLTGRSQGASTAPTFGRLTRFVPGCGGVMWSRIYTATAGVPGLTGQCEITDVVEEPDTLLAVGTAQVVNTAAVPFLLRVDKATGNVVQAMFYAIGDPGLNIRGDGLAQSFDAAGNLNGYVFDGRYSSTAPGVNGPTSNYIVRVNVGLAVVWAQLEREFEPCHACVRTFRNQTLLAGTRTTTNNTAADVWGQLVDSGGGAMIWGWNYGHGLERGNGVSITNATPTSPMGPIIVGVRDLSTAAGGGYLVKSNIFTGSSGGCENNVPPPAPMGAQVGAQFAATFVQNIRNLDMPLIPETLRTVDACPPFVPPCCTNDFDGDGDVGTDADIAAFFACLGGNCCPTCGSPDFNCDGDIGTDADIASFFSVLGGGPC